jgi:HSP20 family protein
MTRPSRYRGAWTPQTPRTPTVWEPSGPQTWTDEPMARMRALNPRVSRLLDELMSDWPGFPALTDESIAERLGEMPLAELEELDDAWLARVELPGVRREDVDIQLAGRRVSVRAERKETERRGLLRRTTRTTGRYAIDIVLPGDVDPDDVDATLEDGVLTIRVAKPQSQRGGTRTVAVSQPGATRPAG